MSTVTKLNNESMEKYAKFRIYIHFVPFFVIFFIFFWEFLMFSKKPVDIKHTLFYVFSISAFENLMFSGNKSKARLPNTDAVKEPL